MARKKMGEILIEGGLITEEQLQNSLTIQKGKNKRIGKVLIELGYVNEMQIAETLSTQLSLPLVDCALYDLTVEILSLVPKEIAEKKMVLPLEKQDKSLLLAMADPLDWHTTDDLSFQTGLKIKTAVSSESNIVSAIEKFYGSSENTWDILKEMPVYEEAQFVKDEVSDDMMGVSLQSLYKESEAPPIVRLVTMIIADAVNANASDIHIEPRDNYVQVRYRIDGNLKNIHHYSKQIQDAVISRVKIISDLDITNRRFPQDGRSALRMKDKNIDLRVSTLPSVYGETIVIRLLDASTGLIPLSKLGIPDHVVGPLIEIFSQPQGMLLITGPTGSGKTTTLYSILQQLRNEIKNIITIEDPVEYKIRELTQVGTNEAIGFGFSNALRSVLRQDPDIIMIGEIRDLDTAEIASRSALTGHFVLSTLHTNDTVSAITRLIDIGLEPFMVNSAVTGVLAQRLIRKICPHCKVQTPPPEELRSFNLSSLNVFYRGEGCKECNNTGYLGRIGVYELLRMDRESKNLISKTFTEDKLWTSVRKSGTKTLIEDAWSKIGEGITTVDEVISKIPYPHFLFEQKKTAPRKKKTKVPVAS